VPTQKGPDGKPVRLFRDAQAWERWLDVNHAASSGVWLRLAKKSSRRTSVTFGEALDVALCFGWIDGVRRRVDEMSYANRFTPRQRRSTWSAVNIKRAEELIAQGLMHPAGLAAFERRRPDGSGIYSGQRHRELEASKEARLRANERAWSFFQAQAPWYRRAVAHWVMSAKKEDTRIRRLNQLIDDSEHGRTIGPLTRPPRQR
jgi:uncharacterized protein YdeI (YjbR/CyaY-like superfamily)